MRFFLVLALIVGVVVLALKGCSSKLAGLGKSPEPPKKIGDSSVVAVAPSRDLAPGVPVTSAPLPGSLAPAIDALDSHRKSAVFRFAYREPPLAADLAPLAAGCSFMVDRFSRSVLVAGPEVEVDGVLQYFRGIDVVGGACAVQAWAVYVDKSAQRGFDLVAAVGAAGGVFTAGPGAVIGNSGIVWDIDTEHLRAALSVVCDGSVVEVIQRPHVHLEQGSISRIESIQEVPIPSTSVSQGIAQTSVEYRKVGLQLEVTPFFLGGERLRLGIVQSNGLIGREVRIGDNDVPIIETQSVSSSVEMTVGQTVILGGVSTLRNRTAKGLFKNIVETSEGSLYVIISTASNIPRAMPVGSPIAPVVPEDVPFGLPPVDPVPSMLDQLLPEKGWEKAKGSKWRDEEVDLVEKKLARIKGRPGG